MNNQIFLKLKTPKKPQADFNFPPPNANKRKTKPMTILAALAGLALIIACGLVTWSSVAIAICTDLNEDIHQISQCVVALTQYSNGGTHDAN